MLKSARLQHQLEQLAELVMNLSSSRVRGESEILKYKARRTMDLLWSDLLCAPGHHALLTYP